MEKENLEAPETVTHKHFKENKQVNKNNFALLELGEFLLSCEKFNSIGKMEMLYT